MGKKAELKRLRRENERLRQVLGGIADVAGRWSEPRDHVEQRLPVPLVEGLVKSDRRFDSNAVELGR